MITLWSVAAGLVWGTLFGLIGARVTKKMTSGSEREISSMSLVRTVMDVIALAASADPEESLLFYAIPAYFCLTASSFCCVACSLGYQPRSAMLL